MPHLPTLRLPILRLPVLRYLVFALIGAGNTHAFAAPPADPGVACPVETIEGAYSWSPDSRRLVFAAPDGQLQILSVRFRTVHRMTETPFVGRPTWSPNGERIAILQSEGADDSDLAFATLYMWNGGANPPTPLASGLSARMTPLWSPDGKQLLAQTVDGDLVTVDARTGAKKLVYERKSGDSATALKGRPAWVSENEVIYQVGEGALSITHVETGGVRHFKGPGAYAAFHPLQNGDIWASLVVSKKPQLTLLSDGKVIRTIAAPVGLFSGPNQRGIIAAQFHGSGLRLIDSATGFVSTLTQNADDSAPLWSPDGHVLGFTRRDPSLHAVHLCIAAVP